MFEFTKYTVKEIINYLYSYDLNKVLLWERKHSLVRSVAIDNVFAFISKELLLISLVVSETSTEIF